MQEYTVNARQRKKALREVRRQNFKDLKTFPKVCFYIAVIMKCIACAGLGGAILYWIFWNADGVTIFFHIMMLLMVYLPSAIPQTVYVLMIDREFRFRLQERLRINPDGFVYYYHDDRVADPSSIFSYDIKYSQIEKIEYNEKTRILTCYGSLSTDTYSGGRVTETIQCRAVDIMDIYDGIELKQVLEEALATRKENP